MSLFQKVRAVTLGGIHDLLDKAIDMNSTSVVRQYVRDLESALNNLTTEVAVQNGTLRTMAREKAELDAKIENQKVTVTQLLKSVDPTAAQLARDKAKLILTEQTQSATIANQIATQTKTNNDLYATVQRMQAKHDEMVIRVRELERIDRDSKAKENAASAVKQAGSIFNSADTSSVDDLQERMLRRNDVANAKFDQAMGSVASEPETNSSEVDELLASLK
jgi:phage shock protein A